MASKIGTTKTAGGAVIRRSEMGIMRETSVTWPCGHEVTHVHVSPNYGGPDYGASDLPCRQCVGR